MKTSKVSDQTLREMRDTLKPHRQNSKWIAHQLLSQRGQKLHHSTIRQRFIDMGEPLGGKKTTPKPTPQGGGNMSKGTFKFKKGDKLIISHTLPDDDTVLPGINDEMRQMKGRSVTISDMVDDSRGRIYSVEECEWAWLEDWLEVKKTKTKREIEVNADPVNPELEQFIPKAEVFAHYVERGVDDRLATHLDLQASGKGNKYPLLQGKQGTGKTMAPQYYAHKRGLPHFLFSCYEDFKLPKLFGDKTIREGNIEFIESLFVKAIQGPCVITFDEINAISQPNTYDFHALTANRELFIKDADNGNGKVYKLHPGCRICFAQNPKSKKYIGGNVRASNFLGRCTYISYPEFTTKELDSILEKAHPDMTPAERSLFVKYYEAVNKTIDKSELPVDISIRQLHNMIDLWMAGFSLHEAIEDGMASVTEAISQPSAKEPLMTLAKGVWSDLNERRV